MSTSYTDHWLDRLRSTRLHPVVEFSLSWVVAVGCVTYYSFHYILMLLMTRRAPSTMTVRIPLVTLTKEERKGYGDDSALLDNILRSWGKGDDEIPDETTLIAKIRESESLRRSCSKLMTTTTRTPTTSHIQPDESRIKQQLQLPPLYRALSVIWNELLKFPTRQEDTTMYAFPLSLIVPIFREDGAAIVRTLQRALSSCDNPNHVQIVLVDAGHCTNLHLISFQGWGQGTIITLTPDPSSGDTGGRGRTLNAGAAHAQGEILTFLHADVILPAHWDRSIRLALSRKITGRGARIIQACVFTYGHDIAGRQRDLPYPWGISAIRFLANFRARVLRLPYGDHVISMPALYFRYLGGYPQQPIMEDYDLMDLLRQRAVILPETVHIIPPPAIAECSVRRWQQYGVVYVTFANAIIVSRYSQGSWSAQDVFHYYYVRRPFETNQIRMKKYS